MSIIDSIDSTFDGVFINLDGTNLHFRIVGGHITSVMKMHIVVEMWDETTDVRYSKSELSNLTNTVHLLGITGILCIEYMDKHLYCKVSKIKDCLSQRGELIFIPKEVFTEVKGGAYESDRVL